MKKELYMFSKILQISGILLLSACNCTYIRKFFQSPNKDKAHYILDNTGRICIYHGANVSNYSKSSPDFLPWQTKEDFARLKTWGFNLVRYLVFWQAIEPTKGTYNQKHIQQTMERVQWLQDLGIDVILDVHQDLYSTKFTGNGFPDWTIQDDGLPFHCRTPWNLNYFEPAVIASYNNFWKDYDLKTRYINMLKYLLQNFDRQPNVIGIDVMNEPFLGTILSFEKKTLTNFYEQIQAMMTDNNFKTEMLFEPMMYTSAGIPTNLEFSPLRDCLYFPHFYDALVHEGGAYTSLNKAIMTRAIAIKQKEAQDFQVPLLFGEFGISPAVQGHVQYLKDFVLITNNNLIGWTVYTYDRKSSDDYGLINNDGTETDLLTSIVTVYPQKIAGKNPKISDFFEGNLTLEYDTDPSITGTTDIFIPDYKGVIVTVNGNRINATPGQVFSYTNDCNKLQHIHISWIPNK
jgi:Endoglucanase